MTRCDLFELVLAALTVIIDLGCRETVSLTEDGYLFCGLFLTIPRCVATTVHVSQLDNVVWLEVRNDRQMAAREHVSNNNLHLQKRLALIQKTCIDFV